MGRGERIRRTPFLRGIITANEEQASAAKGFHLSQKPSNLNTSQPSALENKVDSPTMNECALVLKALGMEGWHNHEGVPSRKSFRLGATPKHHLDVVQDGTSVSVTQPFSRENNQQQPNASLRKPSMNAHLV